MIPVEMFSNKMLYVSTLAVMFLFLLSWLVLFAGHLFRLTFDRTDRYTAGQVAAVLLIPVFGAMAVSFKRTKERP